MTWHKHFCMRIRHCYAEIYRLSCFFKKSTKTNSCVLEHSARYCQRLLPVVGQDRVRCSSRKVQPHPFKKFGSLDVVENRKISRNFLKNKNKQKRSLTWPSKYRHDHFTLKVMGTHERKSTQLEREWLLKGNVGLGDLNASKWLRWFSSDEVSRLQTSPQSQRWFYRHLLWVCFLVSRFSPSRQVLSFFLSRPFSSSLPDENMFFFLVCVLSFLWFFLFVFFFFRVVRLGGIN